MYLLNIVKDIKKMLVNEIRHFILNTNIKEFEFLKKAVIIQ